MVTKNGLVEFFLINVTSDSHRRRHRNPSHAGDRGRLATGAIASSNAARRPLC
jgi:hypothetical protein